MGLSNLLTLLTPSRHHLHSTAPRQSPHAPVTSATAAAAVTHAAAAAAGSPGGTPTAAATAKKSAIHTGATASTTPTSTPRRMRPTSPSNTPTFSLSKSKQQQHAQNSGPSSNSNNTNTSNYLHHHSSSRPAHASQSASTAHLSRRPHNRRSNYSAGYDPASPVDYPAADNSDYRAPSSSGNSFRRILVGGLSQNNNNNGNGKNSSHLASNNQKQSNSTAHLLHHHHYHHHHHHHHHNGANGGSGNGGNNSPIDHLKPPPDPPLRRHQRQGRIMSNIDHFFRREPQPDRRPKQDHQGHTRRGRHVSLLHAHPLSDFPSAPPSPRKPRPASLDLHAPPTLTRNTNNNNPDYSHTNGISHKTNRMNHDMNNQSNTTDNNNNGNVHNTAKHHANSTDHLPNIHHSALHNHLRHQQNRTNLHNILAQDPPTRVSTDAARVSADAALAPRAQSHEYYRDSLSRTPSRESRNGSAQLVSHDSAPARSTTTPSQSPVRTSRRERRRPPPLIPPTKDSGFASGHPTSAVANNNVAPLQPTRRHSKLKSSITIDVNPSNASSTVKKTPSNGNTITSAQSGTHQQKNPNPAPPVVPSATAVTSVRAAERTASTTKTSSKRRAGGPSEADDVNEPKAYSKGNDMWHNDRDNLPLQSNGRVEKENEYLFEAASQSSFGDMDTPSRVAARNGILPMDPGADPHVVTEDDFRFGSDESFSDGGFIIWSDGRVQAPEKVMRKNSEGLAVEGVPPSSNNLIIVRSLDEFKKSHIFKTTQSSKDGSATLGRGAAGRVYLAVHGPSGRKIAVKEINFYDKDKRNQLQKELVTLISHQSRFLVRSFGAFHRDGHVHVTLEYMDRGSLSDTVREHGRIPEPVICKIAEHCLRGLSFLHHNHILHRDVKTGNILLSRKLCRAKLSDFGLARDLKEGSSTKAPSEQTKSVTDTFVGTPAYMAPERLNGEVYTYASDIWALGISVLECALGRCPFDGLEDYFALINAAKSSPAALVQGKVSSALYSFVSAATEPDPQKRPAAQELLNHEFIRKGQSDVNALRDWLDSLPTLHKEDIESSKNLPISRKGRDGWTKEKIRARATDLS